ncbi:hypothetical protein H4696_001010 [Amycolatopsis lexingtonensis]|uniref:MFS transporter n=1 Tax=Amycolatopsis lexingtonensis TaxID=218822 RepID=A0ABR9HSK7_9PSEU|nr:hypothetical protein [Amycolatopsis lexingtonensis]MBE1493910.1 hypothetical protein [Amycolatopsis lexingtonensis]
MTKVIFRLMGVAALLLLWRGVVTFPTYAVVAWAAMSVMIGMGVWQWADDSRGRVRISPARAGVGAAATAFVAGVVGAEILVWSGFLVGSGVLAVVVAAGAWGVRRGSRGGPAVSVRTTVPDAAIEELCLVWRRSGEELRRVPDDDPERGQLAEVRQLLLEEMERRDPAGFRRWVDNGAMTGTEPSAFIHPDRGFAEPGSAAAG